MLGAALCGAIALASAAPVTAGEDGGTVVIYSGRTENLVKPILDRFSEETGIDVEVRYGNTSDLALLIEEEGDQAPADVFLDQQLSLIHISEPTRQEAISYAVFCL